MKARAGFSVALRAMAAVAALGAMAASAGCPSLESYYRTEKDVDVTRDVAYAGDDLPKHTLDIYAPKDHSAPFPVVVFVHGGYWRGGDKDYYQSITGLYG